ncbi:E3 ubiquitin-protein ligase UPL6 [Vitis vinifera]|uniref:HECT-type E3 ubiquitin transferase n=1 Tax=Vitis vinifera TaxID=29760 RepID=A0A438GHE5_VITVI|nr:E3 ubiquitin-protein ligase UPL6 [Vitis vinifera]
MLCAMFEGILVDIPFATFFLSKLKQNLRAPRLIPWGLEVNGKKIHYFVVRHNYLNDLPSLDPELYRHLIFLKVMSLHLSPTHFLCYSFCEYCSYYYFCTLILPIYCDLQHFEGDLSELELYFVIVNNEYGEQTEEELLPGGKNIRVTNENVITFIHLIANHRLNFQIRQQSTHFLRGFQQLIQRDWIEMFDEHELQLLISGSLDGLDVDDLRSNTNYAGGYHSAGHVAWAEGSNFNQGHVAVSQEHYVIETFWEVLKSFTLENQMKFLKAAGSASEEALDRLPTSATCMNLLKLPPYRSKEQMATKLLYAINADAGFGFELIDARPCAKSSMSCSHLNLRGASSIDFITPGDGSNEHGRRGRGDQVLATINRHALCQRLRSLSQSTSQSTLPNPNLIAILLVASLNPESEKVLLLMESGVRLHTTAYVRDKSMTPSGFTLKLRKHIRTRRLEDVRQLGYDRVVLFQFGLGANAHYVILELYAQGNILLTDSEFMVMTLLRSHRDDDKGVAIMSRHRYPVEICRVFERTATTKLQAALTSPKESESNEAVEASEGGNKVSDAPREKQGNNKVKLRVNDQNNNKGKRGSAMQKLSKIRVDQENRVHTLKKEVDHCIKMAELIEYNLEDVDAAILAVRVALANGMNWEDLARMVKEEKKSGNPVAGLIDKLYLERNCMTLLLSNNLDEMDDDEKTLHVDKVEVDLALSAHANARRWYEQKKRQENKQEKTVIAHEKLLRLLKRRLASSFHSSENYLVISGRDAQQNEMIVKRYMSKGTYLHGASSTVIKNHKPEHPVPPLTLNQAGCFTVCHSQAWDSKIVTSAWRVRGEEEGAQDFEENESLKGNSDSESEKEETDEKLPLEERNMLNGNDSEHIADISGGHVSSVNPQLENLIDRALELGSNTASKGYSQEKPYISKAERRKLKKGQKTSTSDAGASWWEISRGQKGKLKKMKEKYADQDEEERSIRMALLAVSTCTFLPEPEEAPKICYKCKKVGHLSRDCPEHPDGTIHSHSNGVEDRCVDLDNSATEMDRVAMEEDDIHEIGEEEKGN